MPIVRPFVLILILTVVFGLGATIVTRLRTTRADTTPALTPAPIDGARAYGYLKQICAIGPRPAGSAANAKQRQMVAQHFTKYGATIREQPFSGDDPQSGAKVDMVNLIGAWHPERTQRVLLGVHYDTRPFPDREQDPVRRQTPYIGANDGGSGVGAPDGDCPSSEGPADHLGRRPRPVRRRGSRLCRERRLLPRLKGIRAGLRRERRGPRGAALRRRGGARHDRRQERGASSRSSTA